MPEAKVVDDYRVFVDAMRDDLRSMSGAPSADAFTAADQALDRTTLADYLVSRGAAAERMHTSSYGEERPIDSASNEMAWSRNRRAQFLAY